MDLTVGKVFSEQKLYVLISGYVLDLDHLSLKKSRYHLYIIYIYFNNIKCIKYFI